ncbi:C2H2 finger domain protein [Cenococcum geophilum]
MNVEDLTLVLKTNLVIIRKRYIIIPKFIFKFTKEYLSIKEANTFLIPEIIFNPSLILSPYVFLLGLLFTDKAFTAPNLMSVERNKLPLPLRLDLDNIPVFRRLIKTPYGHKVLLDQPLLYLTLLPWIKDLGVITGFWQVTRLYSLRYGAGKAFNENSNYADAQTFLKHYLLRRVNVDI